MAKGLKEAFNWREPDLLAISEFVKEKGGYSTRAGMIRQLIVDAALELRIIDEKEHSIWSLIAHDKNRGEDHE